MKKFDFCIVGPGRLGTAVAILLQRKGWRLKGVCGKGVSKARSVCQQIGEGQAVSDPTEITTQSEVVLITTPDDVISKVCSGIAHSGGFKPNCVVAHFSGALTSSAIQTAKESGALIGSIHPIQSFATTEDALDLIPGSYCCIEGDKGAVEILASMAQALKMHSLKIDTSQKVLYHAGAVFASNFLVALQDIAMELESACGLTYEEASKAFMPLIFGTVKNIEKLGTVKALTGPFARGDVETIRCHIKSIRQQCPSALPAYLELGKRSLQLSILQGGINKKQADAIQRLLESS